MKNLMDFIAQHYQLAGISELHREWGRDFENNADFYSRENQEFYVKVLEQFNYKTKKPIVFLPCAKVKPISRSRSHCYMSAITRNPAFCKIIISEPQTIIPYELEDCCPAYDYPPGQLNKRDEWQLVRRLNIFLAKLKEVNPVRKRIYYFGGKHHYILLAKANHILNYFEIVSLIPYRGIRDYSKDAKYFTKIIRKLEKGEKNSKSKRFDENCYI
ncbi:DUF5591 domain-containing protein [Candidatus Harpocratesius sp.]